MIIIIIVESGPLVVFVIEGFKILDEEIKNTTELTDEDSEKIDEIEEKVEVKEAMEVVTDMIMVCSTRFIIMFSNMLLYVDRIWDRVRFILDPVNEKEKKCM